MPSSVPVGAAFVMSIINSKTYEKPWQKGNKTLRKACYTAVSPFSRAAIDSCLSRDTQAVFFVSFFFSFLFFCHVCPHVFVCVLLRPTLAACGSNCIWQSHGKLIFCQMREHFAAYLYMPCVLLLFIFTTFLPIIEHSNWIVQLLDVCPIGTLCVVVDAAAAAAAALSPPFFFFVLH